MKCPYCKAEDSRVIDSRSADDGRSIRRRRECVACQRRFTTYEVVEQVPLMVVKRDGRRAPFDKNKLLGGLVRSCEKRDIPTERVVALSDEIEHQLRGSGEREIPTREIGELVMARLKDFDEVAYIRFASVYRKFADIGTFKEELDELLRERKRAEGGKP